MKDCTYADKDKRLACKHIKVWTESKIDEVIEASTIELSGTDEIPRATFKMRQITHYSCCIDVCIPNFDDVNLFYIDIIKRIERGELLL